MTKTYYTYYNSKINKYINEDSECVDLNEAFMFSDNEKELAEDGLKDLHVENTQDWKVIGVRVSYETFDI